MIQDHLWLLNINKLFKGKKYLLIASKADTSTNKIQKDTQMLFKELAQDQKDQTQSIIKALNTFKK